MTMQFSLGSSAGRVLGVRSRLAWSSVLALATVLGACGDPAPETFSSTLEMPPGPGDGYSLVRANGFAQSLRHVAAAGNHLFFSTAWNGFYRMPKYGGAVESVDVGGNAESLALTSHDDEVYWLRSSYDHDDFPNASLKHQSSSGGSATTLASGSLKIIRPSNSENLIADASHVYMLGEGFIEARSKDGGAPARVTFPWDEHAWGVASFQADYPFLYLADCTMDSSCNLVETDLSAGTSRPLATASTGTVVAAIDAVSLYLMEEGKTIAAVSRADGTRTPLFSTAAEFLSWPLLVDADNLYFLEVGLDEAVGESWVHLLSLPKAGGTPTTIGTDRRLRYSAYDVHMAQDEEFVFVVTSVNQGPSNLSEHNEILAFPKRPVAP